MSHPLDYFSVQGSRSHADSIVSRLLSLCQNLEGATLLYLRPGLWRRLEQAIPPSLKRLTLGPGPTNFSIRELTQAPRLEQFTGVFGVLSKTSFEELVACDFVRKVRFFTWEGEVGALEGLVQENIASARKTEGHKLNLEFLFSYVLQGWDVADARRFLRLDEGDEQISVKLLRSETWDEALLKEFTSGWFDFIGKLHLSRK